MWSGVWGRDESVFGDWSISLSHVLVDFKRLYSTFATRDGVEFHLSLDENKHFITCLALPCNLLACSIHFVGHLPCDILPL